MPPSRYSRHAHPPIENHQHFLSSCRKKILVWTTAVVDYLDPALAHFSLCHYNDLIHLTTARTLSVHFQSLSIYQVVACILQVIWVAHYQVIFDNLFFVPLTVISHIHKALTKLQHEENYHLDI